MQERSKNHVESFKDKRLLKAEDIASILNISLGFAYLLMKRGDVPTIRLGRAVRVRPSDLEDFMQNRLISQEDNLNNREVFNRTEVNYD